MLLLQPFEAFFKYLSLEHINAEVVLGIAARYVQSRAGLSCHSLQKRLLRWRGK